MTTAVYLGGKVLPCRSRVQDQIQRPSRLHEKREPPHRNPPRRFSGSDGNYPKRRILFIRARVCLWNQEIRSRRTVGYARGSPVIGQPGSGMRIAHWRSAGHARFHGQILANAFRLKEFDLLVSHPVITQTASNRAHAKDRMISSDGGSQTLGCPVRVGKIIEPAAVMTFAPPEMRVNPGEIPILQHPLDQARASLQHPITASPRLRDLGIAPKEPIEADR
jgi:hypothetical protein